MRIGAVVLAYLACVNHTAGRAPKLSQPLDSLLTFLLAVNPAAVKPRLPTYPPSGRAYRHRVLHLQEDLEAENAALRAELAALRKAQQQAENVALKAEVAALRDQQQAEKQVPNSAEVVAQREAHQQANTVGADGTNDQINRDVAAAIAALGAAGTLALLGVGVTTINADMIALAVGAVSAVVADEDKGVVGQGLRMAGAAVDPTMKAAGGAMRAASEVVSKMDLTPKATAAVQLILEAAIKGASWEVGARAVQPAPTPQSGESDAGTEYISSSLNPMPSPNPAAPPPAKPDKPLGPVLPPDKLAGQVLQQKRDQLFHTLKELIPSRKSESAPEAQPSPQLPLTRPSEEEQRPSFTTSNWLLDGIRKK